MSKKNKDFIEFYVVDSNDDIAADGFECYSDAIHAAHDLAAAGNDEYFVERIARRKMGSAKPVVTTEWVKA